MNKIGRLGLYFVFGVLLAVAGFSAFADHTYRHYVAATVHKMHEGGTSCSAVMIAPERALTAAHCLGMTSPVVTIEGIDYPVTEAYASTPRDLAILFIPGAPCPCAVVSNTTAVEGDYLVAVGYPWGMLRVVTYGEMQGRVILEEDGLEYLFVTTLGAPGNSGGGLFNDQGELVGITVKGAQGHSMLAVELFTVALTNFKRVR